MRYKDTPLHVLTEPVSLQVAAILLKWNHLYLGTISDELSSLGLSVPNTTIHRHCDDMVKVGLLQREKRRVHFVFFWITPLCVDLIKKHNLLDAIESTKLREYTITPLHSINGIVVSGTNS